MRSELTDYQAKYFAHELQRSHANDHVGKLAGLLFDAQVDPKPHQIDAALFALKTPFRKGVILADEVGMGKTIEAGIVISQFWSERKRKTLIIAPSSLRQQWKQELYEKFLLPAQVVDSKNKDNALLQGDPTSPLVLICSYDFARRHTYQLQRHWDLVIADEAHRLRNYYTGRAKTAGAISQIFKMATKTVLLTATPLQNRLEELYGLVATFDPEYFTSLDAFRERYIKGRDFAGDDDLVARVSEVSKRTLRKDAQKYIQFTERMALTVEFTPSPEEQRLYELVNDYLRREELFAFAPSQRHLSKLIIRKRLGSSTHAVAGTLENIAARLADEAAGGHRRDSSGGLFFDEDLTSDEIDEATADSPPGDRGADLQSDETQKLLSAEVQELRDYAAFARSIEENQKAVKLSDALAQGFDKLREIGAPEKAIIFTDSTKTQEYLARVLVDAGWGDGLLLFNGTNDSPEATNIYRDWLHRHRDSDLVTNIPAMDRRKALVDHFRDQGTIMIATEAAAEGINLQFCSMLVNYDLPWNPQRVEQRIGRVHRFGQKHNVVVVNFFNKGNTAEQRILELLQNKFHLFDSVFGASDEVLGAIEDGLDFEKKISDILSRHQTAEEIEAAFKRLEAEYAEEISQEMSRAKAKVFDNLDPHVQDRLKSYDATSEEVLNRFERLLLSLTRYELRDHADFHGDGRQFTLRSAPLADVPTGQYFFKSKPLENGHHYRYASPLAQHVIETAQVADTPPRELTFSIGQSERVTSGAKSLAGGSGELTVNLVTFSMTAGEQDISESYILAGGYTDNGDWIDEEYIVDLLDLTCTHIGRDVQIDTSRFARKLDERKAELEHEVQGRNAQYYNQQEEVLDHQIQDKRAEYNAKLREYEAKEKEARKLAKNADDPAEQLKHKKNARKWGQRIHEAEDDFRVERRRLRDQADEYLELIEQALQGTQSIDHLFSIRWRIES